MKYQIMIDILFTLLSKRRSSAGELAAKFGVSQRTVYRYLDEMTIAGIPIDVRRGAGGGVFISDAFKLPKGFMTQKEYGKTIEALLALKGQMPDDGAIDSALEKLSAQVKSEKQDLTISGNILVDSGSWGDTRQFSDKLALVERAVEEREALRIDYVSREGERSQRKILPHLLVYKQNIWYVYAYCTKRSDFRLFKLGRMLAVIKTGETFTPLPFSREQVPLTFWHSEEHNVEAEFLIAPVALPFAEEWLGIENIRERGGQYFAEVSLPDDASLVGKILSAGAGLAVLAPEELRSRVTLEARRIAERYRD